MQSPLSGRTCAGAGGPEGGAGFMEASPRFKSTRWSLVVQSRGEGESARLAMEELCRTYWFPLYACARRSGMSPEQTEDAVQGFFVQVIEKDLFTRADPNLGKLRTFLLTAFRRFLRDEREREQSQRRGGGRVVSFDAAEAEQWYVQERLDGETPEHMFDREWALTILDQAMARLEAECAGTGKGALFQALRPFLTAAEGSAAAYAKAGEALGLNENAVKVAVFRMRGRFRDLLRKEVAETTPLNREEEVDGEMAYLLEVLRFV